MVLLWQIGSIWQNGCIRVKVGGLMAVVFGQNGCIWANRFFFGKLVLSGQIGSLWSKW